MIKERSQWAKWVGILFFLLGTVSVITSCYQYFTGDYEGMMHMSQPSLIWTFVGNIGNIFFGITLFFQKRATLFWLAYGTFVTIVVSALYYRDSPTDEMAFLLLVGVVIQLLVLLLVIRLWKTRRLY